MNVLFLTIGYPQNANERNIYSDLMEEFAYNRHSVYVVNSCERRNKKKTNLIKQGDIHVLSVKTGNLQKTNIIEKGISTLLIENQYIDAIKKFIKDLNIDLIIYSTPPITFTKVIKFLSKSNNALTYLLLKDIFPQNAVDLGMLSKRNIIYKYFRSKEIKLYKQSNYIGCMSSANVNYILDHNRKFITKDRVEICPNSIKLLNFEKLDIDNRVLIKQDYGISKDSLILLLGGNLGKPQGIDFLIEVIKSNSMREDVTFFIVGSGTEYMKLKAEVGKLKIPNVKIFEFMPQQEYENLIKVSDIGLIFLNYKFTIPNFPSRVLDYMKYKKPILAATDDNTDLGEIIEVNCFGKSCSSTSVREFNDCLAFFLENREKINEMGENARKYLKENYSVEHAYSIIMKHFV